MEILKNNIFFKGLDRLVYWSKLFAILMIIVGVLMGLLAIFVLFGFNKISALYGVESRGVMSFWMFFGYGVTALLYIVPGTWLLNFSNKTRKGINEKDESKFAEGFRNIGRYYTFWGIMCIVMLSIYTLLLLLTSLNM